MATLLTWLTRAASRSLALVLLAGCGPAAAERPPTHAPPVTIGAPRTFSIEAPPPSQATRITFERPPIEEPENIGCRLQLDRWKRADYPLNLYLGIGKSAWGQLEASATSKVSIAIEDGFGSGVVTVEHAGVRLRSAVHADEVRLRPRRARTLRGFATPLPSRRLQIERIVDGKVEVVVALGDEFVSTAQLREMYDCSDLSLSAVSFVPAVARAHAIERAELRVGTPFSLHVTNGTPTTDVEPSRTITVDILERGTNRSRVRWESSDVLIFGWVPTTVLAPQTGASSTTALVGLAGGASARAMPGAPEQPVRCTAELPLIVWQRGHARTVGTIAQGTLFEPSVVLGELLAIDIPGLPVHLEDGGFYAEASAVAKNCRAAGAQE